MHSASPYDPSDRQPALEDESWRAEVASRVSSYRRRKQDAATQNSLSLNFGAASTPAPAVQPPVAPAAQSQAAPPRAASSRAAAQSSRGAFDTNYYRRLNAESLAEPAPRIGVTMEATALAQPVQPSSEPEIATAAEVAPNADSTFADDDALGLDLELRPNAPGDANLDRYCISEAAEPAPEPVPEPPAPVVDPSVPLAQGNLIMFRRPLIEPPLVPQPSRDELAEPVNNRPRILEVPEDIMPPVQGSLFPEIRLDADEPESSAPREPEIEVPLRVASCSLRLSASLVDLGLVLAGGVLFAGMAWFALPGIPHNKLFWMVLGAVTILFWAVYQHLFLLYAGRTVGMSLRGIHLRTFDGHVPQWKQRGRRARFMFISFASVALGFLWALVDEDALCWHDRISQTFPTTE